MRFFILLIPFVSCAYLERSLSSKTGRKGETQKEWSIEFKKEQVLDKGLRWKGLLLGGLSGLAYDPASNYFYALSDSKKNPRLYRLSLKKQPDYHFEILDSILLKEPDKTPLKRNMDPEELVFYNKDKVFISSEGQQVYKEHESTQIFTFRLPEFSLEVVWPVPPVFWPPGQKKQTGKIGQQSNKGFEALALDKVSNRLWAGIERPLFQDLKIKQPELIRLSEFDIKSRRLTSQFLYPVEKDMGLTAMFFLSTKEFLTLERIFDGLFFTVKLFLTDCGEAEDIKDQIILEKASYKLCSKEMLWSSTELDFLVDNLEGISLVPIENSQKKLLILVSDNNFLGVQKNQFLFFELVVK